MKHKRGIESLDVADAMDRAEATLHVNPGTGLKPMASNKIVGKHVTCLYVVEAYYSGYGGRPYCAFKPGDVAIVTRIAPKVRIVRGGPHKDGRETFLVCDFERDGKTERVGLNWCNATLVKR